MNRNYNHLAGVPCYNDQCQMPTLSKSCGDSSHVKVSPVSTFVITVGHFGVFVILFPVNVDDA